MQRTNWSPKWSRTRDHERVLNGTNRHARPIFTIPINTCRHRTKWAGMTANKFRVRCLVKTGLCSRSGPMESNWRFVSLALSLRRTSQRRRGTSLSKSCPPHPKGASSRGALKSRLRRLRAPATIKNPEFDEVNPVGLGAVAGRPAVHAP